MDSKKRQEPTTRETGSLLIGIGREMRTPLNGIIGMLAMLGETDLSTKQRHYHRIAKSAADALVEFVNDLPNSSTIGRRDSVRGRILIAEDNEISQLVVGEILRSGHFQYEVVSDGWMAVEAMCTRPYDVVLMDCEMPEMDGFAATREFRKLEGSSRSAARGENHLPIIALTAHGDRHYHQKCASAGMDDFISKPIDSERLLARIEHWLTCANQSVAVECEDANSGDGADRLSVRPAATGETTAFGDRLQPPLNIASLRNRCLGNDDLMQRVLRLFMQRVGPGLARILDAIHGKDTATVAKLAHALKGAVANVSAEAAMRHAALLEQLADAGRLAQAHEQFLTLQRELTRCVAFVEAALQGNLQPCANPNDQP